MMKNLVFEHGAVIAAIYASDRAFMSYKAGVLSGCSNNRPNHAVTVVGYGTENGKDYWLVKNSWGSDWGDKGFVKLERGVNMCSIGKIIVHATCEKTSGPTDAPATTTTEAASISCEDDTMLSNCKDLAKTQCYKSGIAAMCKRSCGLCPGQTPAYSVNCYDRFRSCKRATRRTCERYMKDYCKISCEVDGC